MKQPVARDLRLCVAPMLGWTDRHERFFLRLITRRTLLYTEMITTGALLHGDRDRLLALDPREHPVALQLGGSDPDALAACARMAEDRGYDEINLNCGCPSPRVQSGGFGACLLAEPGRVADCIAAMRRVVSVPVTVKTRIGVDERDSWQDIAGFVATVAEGGCRTFIIHARKAWLTYPGESEDTCGAFGPSSHRKRKKRGPSPLENRTIPPLRYDVALALKAAFPKLQIVLNGGVETLETAKEHLDAFDGVMIGRAAYHHPYRLARADQMIFGDFHPVPSRHEIVAAFLPYVERQRANGVPLGCMTRHILGLFSGLPGARAWRRTISSEAHVPGAGTDVLLRALEQVSGSGQDEADMDGNSGVRSAP